MNLASHPRENADTATTDHTASKHAAPHNRFAVVLWSASLVFSVAAFATADDGPQPLDAKAIEFFEQKIRPVLVAHCYECHATDAAGATAATLKGSLAVDTRQGLLEGGESGPAIVPGRPAESLLLKALRHDGDVSEMPPAAKLPDGVIADFEQWIATGAHDPRDGPAAAKRKGMSIEEGRRFWSLIPPRAVAPPEVTRTDWPLGEVDRFILARQEQRGLEPLADTDAATLLRRLHFDLIGLPPSTEELDDFVSVWQRTASSDGDSAREQILHATVDRLLASPHFGERWGRHWLDVARYADSNGRDRNIYFYHAWRYRNYVIDSLNQDKPFDQFLREQIAGDLLPADSPRQRDEQHIATGFLALGAKAFEEAKPEIFRMDLIDEQIELLGRAVLGLSVGCARCHDHKFDPIPTADYYALAGIFRSTEPLYGYGPKGIKSNVHTHSQLQAVGAEADELGPVGLAYLESLHQLTLEQNTMRSDRYRVVRRLADAKLQLDQPDVDRAAVEADIARMEDEIQQWDVKVKAAEAALQAAMDAAPPQPDWAMGVRERATPEDCRIHVRGETTNLGDVVPRGMLQVVALDGAATPEPNASGRLELAQWLTRRDHPLTARVAVNRAWLLLFGRGLVTTPDDLGVNGARPTHPELLDYLAVRFMDEGWSLKQLVRTLVLSRTYRLSSSAAEATVTASSEESESRFARQFDLEPDNETFWRMRPRRLEAEILRDAMMSLAGTLDLAAPQPQQHYLAQFNPYREDEYRTYKPLFMPQDIQQANRSVYLPVVRGVLPEIFPMFDFASPERPVAQRDESLVPAQSLYFMNNAWVLEQSSKLAKRLLEDPSLDEASRLGRLYQMALGRRPTPEETARAVDYLQSSMTASSESASSETATPPLETLDAALADAWISLCQVVLASAEFRYLK